MNWDSEHVHLRQIERKLLDYGSKVEGLKKYHADRVADLVEQIDELRKKLDVMGDWIKANVTPKRNDDGK